MLKRKNVLVILFAIVTMSLLAGCVARGGTGVVGTLASGGNGVVARETLTESVEASGSLQAGQFATLVWKTSGTVAQVKVKVGDKVKVSDVLLALDPTSVPANVISARSDLLNAQQSLDDLKTSRLPQAQALQALEQAQQAYDQRDLNLQADQAQARLALIAAQDALDEAQRNRTKLDYDRGSKATMDAAEADYLLAQMGVSDAEARYGNFSGRADDDPVRANALAALSAAKEKRDRALARLNWLKGKPTEAEIQEADVKLQQAQVKLEEARQAWDKIAAGLSPAGVELLDAKLTDAKRAYEQIQNGPNPGDVAQLEARIEAAQATVNQLYITAPFNGEVLVLDSVLGDVINAGQAALVVANRQGLYVEVQVDESEIGRVQPGDPAQATLEAMPDVTLKGSVSFVNPVGQTVGGLVKYTVRIDFSNAPAGALLGTTTDVSIQTGEPASVLVVPVDAVQNDDQGEYVLKITGDPDPVRVAVHSGELVGDQVVVTGDLQEGDKLLLTLPTSTQTGPGAMFGR